MGCNLCPRACDARRTAGEIGVCGAPADIVVASASPHFGEEPVLVGRGGSGTIFLSGCSLRCPFCQNADISHEIRGRVLEVPEVADLMLALEAAGCANVNLVTPTHFADLLSDAIREARRRGLAVPVVWNCGGYETLETLRGLEGLVEIYMPDFKLWDPDRAEALLGARDYPERAREAMREMHRQVGDLRTPGGVATQGLLVRHLAMPGGVDDGRAILDFLADEISPRTAVNVMEQYHPAFRASEYADVDRRPTHAEWSSLREHALSRGLPLAG
jgi:putative pyruvate formate lyase activating enzyme